MINYNELTYDEFAYRMPKETKWERLLKEHGYEEKREVRLNASGRMERIILLPKIQEIKVADNPDGKNYIYTRLGENIYGEFGETKKHLAMRLGWI